MRARPLRVFVTHTSELARYPPGQSFLDAACAGVRRVDAVPVTMLDLGARQDVPFEVCRNEVLGCDVHLSVLGFRYGTPIPEMPGQTSYVEFEFDVATEAGMPRLVFLIDDRTPLPPALVDEDRGRIARFRDRVRAGAGRLVSVMVSDPGHLEAAVSQALVRLTKEDVPAAGGVPWVLPPLSAPVVDRPDLVDELLPALTAPLAEAGDLTTTLEGAGGFGKTTLAVMVCRRPEIRSRFPGGLLWVTVGEQREGAELAATIGELCAALSGASPATADPMLAGARLGELLDEREPALLVLDDVWRAEQLAPFLIGGTACRRLVTTRNAGVAPRGGRAVVVGHMTAEEARRTLTAGLDELPAGVVSRLLEITGRWAVLLGLVNGTILDQVRLGATAEQAGRWALRRLESLGPTAFDVDEAGSRSLTVAATIGASLDLLTPDERERYLELAAMPEDVDVPPSALALLWAGTGGLAAAEAERLRARLVRLRLVIGGWSGASPTLRLHDVHRAFLRHQSAPDRLAAWNRALVEEARRLLPADGRAAWWQLPGDAAYLWRTLPYHLAEAGLADELAGLVCDLRWIAARIERTGSSAAAEADLGLVRTPVAAALRRALGQSSHLLAPMEPAHSLGATLAGRLDGVPELATTVARYRRALPRPQLVPSWPRADQTRAALLRTLSGHDGGVYGCAFSPDGSLLAATGGDRTVRLWEVGTGRPVAVLAGHADRVYDCAFSPDGTLLATASEDGTARLWDLATRETRHVLTGHTDGVYACAFSGEGAALATTGDDHRVRIWDAASGDARSTLTCHDAHLAGCAFARGTILLASVDEANQVRICEAETGVVRLVATGHAGPIRACAFSPDGEIMATAGADGTVRLVDVAAGAVRHVLRGHRDEVVGCAFAPGGEILASAGEDQTTRLWDTATGSARAVLTGHTGRVYGCAFTADGALLATAGRDGTVRLWDAVAAAVQLPPEGHTDRVTGCAFSPDGELLASASWDHTVRLWSVAGGAARQVLGEAGERVSDCAFAPDGRTLASVSWDGALSLWQVPEGGRVADLGGHSDRAYGCAFSETGDLLASAGADGEVRLWETPGGGGGRRLAGHAGPVHRCRFAPGGSILASAGVDGTVRLWDAASGSPRRVLTGHEGWVFDCAFSPDGRLLASAGVDGTVRIWDVASGSPQHVLAGHDGWVHGCAFSSDGALLASAGADGCVRLWDPGTGRCRCALRLDDRLLGCAWHPRAPHVGAVGVRGVHLLAVETDAAYQGDRSP